ncbi:MAG: hypothetical protein ACI8RD_013294, partial [Bacillariaceae sp.]
LQIIKYLLSDREIVCCQDPINGRMNVCIIFDSIFMLYFLLHIMIPT